MKKGFAEDVIGIIKGKKTPGFAFKLAVVIAVLLLAANFFLGSFLMNSTKNALKTLIQNRMLDISNTAAASLDGDVLRDLKAEDEGTEKYQIINDTLAVYQENIDLKYIYCIRKSGESSFTFTVDPTINDPGTFGDPIVTTDALITASNGTPAVDEEPYTDAWGRFYSAYSPVFDSEGKVGGIVAVDFSADWYDAQIAKQAKAILINSIISVLFGIIMVLVATRGLRNQIGDITEELGDVVEDIDGLTREINPDAVTERMDISDAGDVKELGDRIHQIKEAVHEYVQDKHSQVTSMITALSSDYRSVYYINLDQNEGICYQSHSEMDDGLQKGENFKYEETLRAYVENYVVEKNREEFLEFLKPDSIRKNLMSDRVISLRYMVNRNGQESYEMVRVAGVRRPEDRDDHIVHAIGLGFADVDSQTRKAIAESQALSDALKAAQDASRAKTAFLSNMSHEIRTPMNAIIGLDHIALSEPDLPESTREHLEKIGSSADYLLKIINDILDMSRIEAGKMVLKSEVFSLNALMDQIDVMIGGQCNDKGLNWHCEKVGDIGEYYIGDDMKLKQVLINILGNSVKFTGEGGDIFFKIERIRSYDNKSVFRFTMRDTGIGMSEDYIPRMFEPFSQEDFSTKTIYGSTGLGMSITKNIVEMMNGEIGVTSKKGEGTTFIVTLTLEESANAGEAGKGAVTGEKSEAAKDGDSVLAKDACAEDVSAEAAEKAPVAEDSLKGKHFLLAEDIPVNAKIVMMILKKKEAVVDHAENGRLALEMFEKSEPGFYSAILMDMRMPEMDGLEATRAIRDLEREDAKKIPIIALTANAFEEDVERSLQSGLNAHLSKPIEPDVLYETLARLI